MEHFEAVETPLYLKLTQYLRERILKGELAAGSKLPSERELSDETGLSRVTVNKALTSLVDEGWLFRRRGLGTYVATEAERARVMASGKTKNIGVVYAKGVLYSGEPFYSRVLQGIEREANHEDHHVLLTTVDSESRSHSSFLSALRSRKIDGAIVIGMIPSDTILELEQTGVPFVLIDFDIPRTPYARVLIDNRHGIDQVVDYLYGMGHRKVGFIGAEMDLPSIAERAETFERALAQRSMPQFDGWRAKGNLTSPSGFQACQHIMEQSQRPSAIISVNDEMAIGAMKYCQQAGIELPKDLSLVGFDNIEWSQHCYPALTTVNVPKEKMGKHAVMILLDMIQQTPASSPQEQAEAGPCVLVKTKLIIRDSVMRWSEPEKTGR